MKKNKMIIITLVIAIVLFFGGLIVGFSMGKSSQTKCKTDSIETTTQDEPQKEEIEEKKEKEERTNDYELKTIKSEGEKITVDINLNDKQNTLVFENRSQARENSTLTFGQTNLNLLSLVRTGNSIKEAPEEIEYKIIIGSDDKEYLYVAYQRLYNQFIIIINDETNIIGQYSSSIESISCYAALDSLTNDYKPLYKVENNSVYYYKYVETIKDNRIMLEMIKLEVADNKVKEIKTGTRVSGKSVQCS